MELSKQNLSNYVHRKLGVYSKDVVEAVINQTFVAIAEQLAVGNTVRIHKFGAFGLSERKAFESYNPIADERTIRPARTVPTFRYSKTLSDSVRNTKVTDNKASGK